MVYFFALEISASSMSVSPTANCRISFTELIFLSIPGVLFWLKQYPVFPHSSGFSLLSIDKNYAKKIIRERSFTVMKTNTP
jgi:hypothetical protein